jgi:hypothetical protein
VSSDRPAAELLADGGEAAREDEFFRSEQFLAAEGVTHTLRLPGAGADLFAPVQVREIPAGGLDATSPYGFPGASGASGDPVDPAAADLVATGLVSVFIRHSLDGPALAGATRRGMVQIADPELEPKSRMSDRQQIRRNLRQGYSIEVIPGPQSEDEPRAGFLVAYTETMSRAAAAERYFYGREYFDRILDFRNTWLVVARPADGGVAAGSIAARSDGMLHYYLSGTADAHLRDSPMKNIVATLCELSTEQGLPLNLGGGVTPGDALEEFKRGFANREQPFHTSELVCDPDAYARLSAGRDAGGFFPAYRAP